MPAVAPRVALPPALLLGEHRVLDSLGTSIILCLQPA